MRTSRPRRPVGLGALLVSILLAGCARPEAPEPPPPPVPYDQVRLPADTREVYPCLLLDPSELARVTAAAAVSEARSGDSLASCAVVAARPGERAVVVEVSVATPAAAPPAGVAGRAGEIPTVTGVATLAPRSYQQMRSRVPKQGSRGDVLLWPDTFNNYFSPQVSSSAQRVLEDAGFTVHVPQGHVCCGRPLYDFGFLDEAKRYLQRTLDRIAPQIDAGMPVVVADLFGRWRGGTPSVDIIHGDCWCRSD